MHGEIEVSGCSGYMYSYLKGMRNLLPHGIPPLEPANLGPRVPIFWSLFPYPLGSRA
jgi:hypothetical protein